MMTTIMAHNILCVVSASQ